MKNTTEVARELATLYGIQFEEVADNSSHILIGNDGSERILTADDYHEVFGLRPVQAFMSVYADQIECVRTLRETLDLDMIVGTPLCANFKQSEEIGSTVESDDENSFALAA